MMRDASRESGECNCPACAVCGESATNGMGQMDPDDHYVATFVHFCDQHRPQSEEPRA